MSNDPGPVQQPGGWFRIRRRPLPHERPTPRFFTLDWPEQDAVRRKRFLATHLLEQDAVKKAQNNASFHCGNSAAETQSSGNAIMGNYISALTRSKTPIPEKVPEECPSIRVSPALPRIEASFTASTVSSSEDANVAKIKTPSPKKKPRRKKWSGVNISPIIETLSQEDRFKPFDSSTPLQATNCGVRRSVRSGRKNAILSPASPFTPDVCDPTEGAQGMNHISIRTPPEKQKSKRAYLLEALEGHTRKPAASKTIEEDPLNGISIPLMRHGNGQIPAEDIAAHAPSLKSSHISSELQTESVEPMHIVEKTGKGCVEQPQAGPKIHVTFEESQKSEKLDNEEPRKRKKKKRKKDLVPVWLYDNSNRQRQRGKLDVTLYDVYLSLAAEIIEMEREECKSKEKKEVLEMFYEEVVKDATRIIDNVQRRLVDRLHEQYAERMKIKVLRKEFDRLGKTLEEYVKENNIQGVHPYQFCFTEEDEWM